MMTNGKEILLDNKGVDAASEAIADWAESVGMERRTALRIRLTAEKLLLRVSSTSVEISEKSTAFRIRL